MANLLNDILNQTIKNQLMLEALCEKLGVTLEEKPTRLSKDTAQLEILSALESIPQPMHTVTIVNIISKKLDMKVAESSIAKYCYEMAKAGKITRHREGIYQQKQHVQLDIVDAVNEAASLGSICTTGEVEVGEAAA